MRTYLALAAALLPFTLATAEAAPASGPGCFNPTGLNLCSIPAKTLYDSLAVEPREFAGPFSDDFVKIDGATRCTKSVLLEERTTVYGCLITVGEGQTGQRIFNELVAQPGAVIRGGERTDLQDGVHFFAQTVVDVGAYRCSRRVRGRWSDGVLVDVKVACQAFLGNELR